MYRAYYKPMSKRPTRPQPETRSVDASVIWAAAAYAHRINEGEYHKDDQWMINATPPFRQREANKTLMWNAIRDNTLLTQADYELGQKVRDWVSKDIMIKTLKGTVRDFDTSMGPVTAMDHFVTTTDRYEIALVCSRPRAYEDAQQLEQAMEGIRLEPLAPVGDKVDEQVTVAKSVYSQNYGVYFITAVTASRHAVFFSYRERLANGHQCRIRGTVKAHRENSTQLNRVKVI